MFIPACQHLQGPSGYPCRAMVSLLPLCLHHGASENVEGHREPGTRAPHPASAITAPQGCLDYPGWEEIASLVT